ncbi:MAG: TFIIB-type zinc ribbon-containing protein [Desulfurococcales archaeon]|nr:TFIIB-type zinc ribbon-containing protein [Desulfurococcales archaeon]
MSIKKCPYCGSENLVIDYWTGTIVCANCGSVIEENISEHEINEARNPRVVKAYLASKRKHNIKLRFTRMVWKEGKPVHIASYAALNTWKLLREKQPLIEEYLGKIEDHPLLIDRSIRVRLGLAYALYLHETMGKTVSKAVKESASRFYLSEKNLRKLFNHYISDTHLGIINE